MRTKNSGEFFFSVHIKRQSCKKVKPKKKQNKKRMLLQNRSVILWRESIIEF